MIHGIFAGTGQFFASLRLTMFLLISLAGAMALGTIYEAEQGTPAARVVFYRAWWFDCLLLLLAGNIIGCTYLRRPKRTTRWAYLLMHQAIIVIFVGGLIGRWWGTEGQLVFAEGQTRSSLLSDRNVLKVKFASGDEYMFQTDVIDAFPRQQRPDHTYSLNRHGVKLRVKTFFPDHSLEPGAIVGDAGDPAAVHLEFTQGRQKARQWMFTGKHEDAVSFGGLPVNVRDGGVLDPQAALPPVGGVLELIGEGGSFHHLLPIEGNLRKTTTFEGTPWKVTVLEAYRRFTMHEGKPVDRPHGEDNPAVIFRLEGPTGSENRVAFSQYPDFDSEHGRQASKVTAKYHFHGHALEIFADAGKRALTGRYVDVDKITVGPLVPGTKYPVGPGGLNFKVLSYLPHARPALVPINKSNQVKQPALEISIETLVGEASTWLVFDEPKEVAFGDSIATLTYTKDEYPLGFDLTLKKFTVGRYEGTTNPSSFESTVDLDDSSRSVKDKEQVISMNRPLVHNGYTCYQSSYVEGERMVSILSIAHDPGGLIAYIGFIGFMIGLICVITFRQNRPGKKTTV